MINLTNDLHASQKEGFPRSPYEESAPVVVLDVFTSYQWRDSRDYSGSSLSVLQISLEDTSLPYFLGPIPFSNLWSASSCFFNANNTLEHSSFSWSVVTSLSPISPVKSCNFQRNCNLSHDSIKYIVFPLIAPDSFSKSTTTCYISKIVLTFP